MRSMKFFGLLNEDGSVTRVVTKNEITLPIGEPVWGEDGPPKRIEFIKLEKVFLESSMFSNRKSDGLTILGYYKNCFILVDHGGLCYSVDCYSDYR